MKTITAIIAGAALLMTPMTASAQLFGGKKSSARKAQEQLQTQIPRCTRKLGTLAIVEPDDPWWRSYQLTSPEKLLRNMVQQSGCFTLVNRGRALGSRSIERALDEDGELQRGSNVGKRQVRTADYFLQPDIVTANSNSGGGGIAGALGGLIGGGLVGRAVGAVSSSSKEVNVSLALVDARTTEEVALSEGYFRKKDIAFNGASALFGMSGFGAGGADGYTNTEIGQVIALAYLQAYTKLVRELGGLPADASAAAPVAE